MKRTATIATLFATMMPASIAAHPAADDDLRCHMHKETGSLHCPKKEETEKSAPDARPMRSREVYFRGCREAHAAGVTPIRRGEPGYRQEMDGDNDGWACERYIQRRR